MADEVIARIETWFEPGSAMPPHVVNATGVILHTSLGRAPWPSVAIRAAISAATGYGYLELDDDTGDAVPVPCGRGAPHRLDGPDDAMIVTDNAAALALAVGLAVAEANRRFPR